MASLANPSAGGKRRSTYDVITDRIVKLLEAETFDRASEEFEAVLAQVPDNILANKFLGETYHRLGRYDEAIQKYQIAQTLAPEDAELEVVTPVTPPSPSRRTAGRLAMGPPRVLE